MSRAVVVGVGTATTSSIIGALEDSRYEILVLTDVAQVATLLDPLDVTLLVLDEEATSEIPDATLRKLAETVPRAEIIRLLATRRTPSSDLSSEHWILERPLNLQLFKKCVHYIRNHTELVECLRAMVVETPEGEAAASGRYHIVDDEWFKLLDRLLHGHRSSS